MTAKRYKPQRRLKPKRSRLKKLVRSRLFWFGIAGLLAVGGIFYGVFFTPFLQIQHIEITGNQKITAERLQQIAKEHVSQKLLFFEMNHFLLADAGGVTEEIRAAFPEVESVVVRKKFPDSLRVTVLEREGVAIWCQERSYEIAQEGLEEEEQRWFRQCFALDKHGVIFEEREPEREVIISKTGANASTIGQQVLDGEVMEKILSFQRQVDSLPLFQQVGLRISSFTVISDERVNAKISEGWELYVNPAGDIDWQITKGKLVLEKEVPFEKRPFLEYIDLRFGDQAYIKYRD